MYHSSQGYQAGNRGGAIFEGLESIASRGHGVGHVSYSRSAPTKPQSHISYAIHAPALSLYASLAPFYNIWNTQPQQSQRYISTSSLRTAYEQSTNTYLMSQPRPEYHFSPDDFLKPGKGRKFVGKAEEIQEFVKQAFGKIFHAPFPENIKLSVLNEKEFRLLAPHPGTIGLSINRGKYGLLSEIFILNDTLGRVMLTVGHELGHVLTETLSDGKDEEAKAYAFSLEWMNVIKEHDIAGLGDAIVTESPAHNGLHDVGFAFVQEMMQRGKKAWEVYKDLVKGALSLRVRVDCF